MKAISYPHQLLQTMVLRFLKAILIAIFLMK